MMSSLRMGKGEGLGIEITQEEKGSSGGSSAEGGERSFNEVKVRGGGTGV